MILARIQGHPSRKELHGPLAKALGLPVVETKLHWSVPPDPWTGYKECLRGLGHYSHVLVVQDDAMPVPNFGEAVQKIAERHPSTPVCLFMGALPAATALQAKRAVQRKRGPYIPLGSASFVPLVAVLWPKQKAREFLEWSRTGKTTRADDGNAARWMRQSRTQFLVTVPSIVQHNDGIQSVKGGREHKPWAESWRQALFLAEDAADYDW